MNVDNPRKPFPYLRKGDGLIRYSSLKLPQYRKSNYSADISRNPASMNEAEKDLRSHDDDNRHRNPISPIRDSGNCSTSPRENLNDENESIISSTPKENADPLEPSLLERRMAWEAREQQENVDVNHFEALERFLAAMNSTLKSDCSLLYKLGGESSQTPTSSKDQTDEPSSASNTPDHRINSPIQSNGMANLESSSPPASNFPNLVHQQRPLQHVNSNHVQWKLPQPEFVLPPRFPTQLRQPVFPFPDAMNMGRFNHPIHATTAQQVLEQELRTIITNLERDADELQRRRTLLEEYAEMAKKQLSSEWHSIEREKELLKIQRMKSDQDKNDLFTHRSKMEDEMKENLERSSKAQEELKLLQTEYQLLKKKLVEQKKLASEEISSVQQQVIDLQRQAVESDSRASSLRNQITKLKDDCRQHKEEAENAKSRLSMLEATNERLRGENTQLRNRHVDQRTVPSALKASVGAGDQSKVGQSQMSKCVRFADDPTAYRQAVCPSDATTQTSFLDTFPALDHHGSLESNPILQRTLGGGKKEIIYPNDTVQIRDTDGTETFNYANGDILRCLPDGTKIYHSACDGRTEVRNADGTLLVKNADGSSEKYSFMPDGAEIVTYSNGTVVERRPYGLEIAHLHDKSKETRCCHYALREFPSGDMKKLFADGATETRLACGRVRVKDAKGNILKDVDEYPMQRSSS